MLTTLRIENFAIVKHLELDFAKGMTAFTGETGAGKSIMIDALMLAMGGRADSSVIRSGEEKCDISAVFHLEAHAEPADWLHEHDIHCDQGELVLRRVLYAEGRSKSSINGQPFPLQKVKELSEMLVHIHGQHQHQTLLHHTTHRQQLDRFADHDALLLQVSRIYKECQKIRADLEALSRLDNSDDRKQLLQFQLDELQALNLQVHEMRSLHDEHQLLHHAHDYLQGTQQILQLLHEDEQHTVCQGLNQIIQRLNELPGEHKAVKNALELIGSALIQCEESVSEIQTFAEQVQLDPQRLQDVEERISALHQAARKYHVDADELPQLMQTMQQELATHHQAEARAEQLQQGLSVQTKAYEQAALLLRQSREQAADKLAAEISAIIQQLGMPKGRVSIDISALDKMQAHGLDKVEYKVCTNPGMAMDTLSKVASGGELSRISLAIQMITAQRGATPTLLFDEVDVGIGGATAALVGQLLRKLGERLQVFCVTHQPQVASSAHHHFVVEKFDQEEQTFSRILSLNETNKIDEIARMLGGLTITEQTRSHAKELLTHSR